MDAMEKRQRGRPRSFNVPADAASVQALDRGLKILAIVAEGDALSLSEVAARSGIAASTAYRMLTTLAAHGMVEFDQARRNSGRSASRPTASARPFSAAANWSTAHARSCRN